MITYLLDPVDTQFYRTNLPFDAGVDGYGVSEIWPRPTTVYGAIKAAALAHLAGADLSCMQIAGKDISDEAWGSKDKKGAVFVKGPFVFEESEGDYEIILPMPADVVSQEQGTKELLLFSVPDEAADLSACTNVGKSLKKLSAIGRNNNKINDTSSRYMISHKYLDWYLLQGTLREEKLETSQLKDIYHQLLSPELRVGIARDKNTRTVEVGRLYSANHYRFRSFDGLTLHKDMGYCCYLEVPDDSQVQISLPNQGTLRLGGESRPARYRRPDDTFPRDWMQQQKEEVIKMVACTGRFKLYLVTPGLFGGRWHPFQEKKHDVFFELNASIPVKAMLKGVAMAGSEYYGGWDIQNRKPKPLEKGVRAGTVYFFEIENWNQQDNKEQSAKALFKHFNFRSLCLRGNSCQAWEDAAKEGFGIALMGGWKDV